MGRFKPNLAIKYMKTKWIKWPFTFFSYLLKPSIEIKPLISFHFWIMTILKNPQIQFIFFIYKFHFLKKIKQTQEFYSNNSKSLTTMKETTPLQSDGSPSCSPSWCREWIWSWNKHDNKKKWNKWCNNFLWFFWLQIFTTWKQFFF